MDKNISRRKFLKDAVVSGVALGSGLGSYRITYGQARNRQDRSRSVARGPSPVHMPIMAGR